MILPVIDYGSVVYDSLSLQQYNKIENLQRRAAIICSGAHPRTETNKLLSDLGWMHLKDRRIYLKRTYFYKIFVNASPPYLNADLMDLIRNPKVRDTRRSKKGKLYQPKWKKTKYRASFFSLSHCRLEWSFGRPSPGWFTKQTEKILEQKIHHWW